MAVVRYISLLVVLVLAGCASSPDLRGLGASATAWRAHHGADYIDVLTDPQGRVAGYVVTMTPRSLASAVELVRADLPADAKAGPAELVEGIEGTKCEIVDFSSAKLRSMLGSDTVTAVFQTSAAITMDTTQISHAVVASAVEGLPRQC